MFTVKKSNLKHVISSVYQAPAHYTFIFNELLEVYDDGVDLSLDDMVRPFAGKQIKEKIPARAYMRDPDNIRYSDYILPLFFTAYVCKNEPSYRVIKEVMCMILREYGHFHYPDSVKEHMQEMFGDNWNDPRHYWGFQYPAITEQEQKQVTRLYHNYVRLVI